MDRSVCGSHMQMDTTAVTHDENRHCCALSRDCCQCAACVAGLPCLCHN